MFLQLFRSLARPKSNPPLSDASDNIFFDSMLYAILEKMHINEPDNYDADRFDLDGTVRSHRFYTRGAFQNLKLLIEAKDAFSASFDLLEDATSREWFKQLLLFRILGHMHVRLPSNRPEHWIMRERAKALARAPSDLPYAGIFGKLSTFEVEFASENITLDCWWLNVAWTFFLGQYYLDRDGVTIRPEPGDYVVDAGACFGDSALAFGDIFRMSRV